MNEGDQTPSFSMVDLRQPGVHIDQNWFAMSLWIGKTMSLFLVRVKYCNARVFATAGPQSV
jgi:hypothetical protein